MRTRRFLAVLLSGLLVAGHTGPLHAWGQLEQIDITGNVPSPIAGHIVARVIGIKWDTRTLPVRYSMNTTLDPVPNPLGAAFLSVADAQAALQASLDQWNEIRTSFIDMRITGTTANPGLRGFDMVNELTFRTAAGFTAIASSPSTSLIADSTFAVGDDIDGDGDSDVAAIATAADFDGDGDIEFPAGFYKAGTILDNDVQFNTKTTNGLRFTVGDAALDTVTRSVDLNTTATHEFGHSLGLAHAMANQISPTNGDGATMFPFIDTGDPEAERLQRALSSDDITWASYVYPEGTASSGPAAIQFGDIPFKWVYGTIEGEIRHGVLNQPLAGASVYAVGEITKRVVAGAYSGTTRLSLNPATGGLFFVDPAFNIVDGKYTIPVPLGLYAVGVEPVDGSPAAPGNINFTCQIGSFFGQMNFNEEFYNRNREAALETRPGADFPVLVLPGAKRTGISIVTSDSFNVNRFGNLTNVGFTGLAPGTYYAMAIPASVIAGIAPGEPLSAQSVLFHTYVADGSTVPRFAEAMITTGTLTGTTATVDLANPLDRFANFVGQEDDLSPFFLKSPRRLGAKIRDGITAGTIENVFLVLRLPTESPFPGVSAFPPLIGLSSAAPLNLTSFISQDGGVTWVRQSGFNFRFGLVLSRLP
jgi:matrixin